MNKSFFIRITLYSLCIGLSLLAPRPVPAAAVSPVDALESLRRNFAGMQDFTADISQEKQLAIMKRKLVSAGTVRFMKPDLFYMELKPPHASRMVLRDTSIEIYLPKEKSRQQVALQAEEGLKRWLSLLSRPVVSLPDGVEVTADRTGDVQTLTIVPQKKGQVRTFTVTSGSDGRLRRLVIDERNGNRTAITFQNLRANVGLSEKDFRVDQ